MTTQIAHSLTLPIDGYLSLAYDGNRICVAATVPGRPWTMYRLDRNLAILRQIVGGTNPAGPPQLYAENDWRWCEQEDAADGCWPEMALRFDTTGHATIVDTGRRIRAGVLQWRDGHVLSVVGNGHVERDGVLLETGSEAGAASIAGEWTVIQNHANTKLYRTGPSSAVLDVPAQLFGNAQIAEDGTVVFSAYPDGKAKAWTVGGSVLDAEMPRHTPQNPNWAWRGPREYDGEFEMATYWLCSGHDGQGCAIGGDTDNGYLGLVGGSEPYARACPVDGSLYAVARWDSLAKCIRVDVLTLAQPFTDPDDPIDPPVDPPDPPPIDPPVDPPPTLPAPTLLISPNPAVGVAPFDLLAEAYDFTGPVTFRVRRAVNTGWTLIAEDVPPVDGRASHVYRFTEAGNHEVSAVCVDGEMVQTSAVYTVSVTAPPEPQKPAWLPIWLWRLLRGGGA